MSEKNKISYSLSGREIADLAGCPVYTLSEVYDKGIEEIVDKKGACILLIETSSDSYGHWTTIICKPPILEFFDSLGQPNARGGMDKGIMDRSMFYKMNPLPFGDMSLTEFLTRDPRVQKVVYTSKANSLQDSKKGVNTCGRWASLRALFSDLSHDEFMDLFHDVDDKKITELTNDLF